MTLLHYDSDGNLLGDVRVIEGAIRLKPETATGASIVEAARDYLDFRMDAAERLARKVLECYTENWVRMKVPTVIAQGRPAEELVAEAKRVLGEKP